MTRSAELRDLAFDLAVRFRTGVKPHDIAESLVDGSITAKPAEVAFLVACIADALDPGHRADLLSQLRVHIPR